MAFVTVIALNVALQVVFDSVVFSYLQLDLRSASWVLTYLYLGACGTFIVSSLLLFRPAKATCRAMLILFRIAS